MRARRPTTATSRGSSSSPVDHRARAREGPRRGAIGGGDARRPALDVYAVDPTGDAVQIDGDVTSHGAQWLHDLGCYNSSNVPSTCAQGGSAPILLQGRARRRALRRPRPRTPTRRRRSRSAAAAAAAAAPRSCPSTCRRRSLAFHQPNVRKQQQHVEQQQQQQQQPRTLIVRRFSSSTGAGCLRRVYAPTIADKRRRWCGLRPAAPVLRSACDSLVVIGQSRGQLLRNCDGSRCVRRVHTTLHARARAFAEVTMTVGPGRRDEGADNGTLVFGIFRTPPMHRISGSSGVDPFRRSRVAEPVREALAARVSTGDSLSGHAPASGAGGGEWWGVLPFASSTWNVTSLFAATRKRAGVIDHSQSSTRFGSFGAFASSSSAAVAPPASASSAPIGGRRHRVALGRGGDGVVGARDRDGRAVAAVVIARGRAARGHVWPRRREARPRAPTARGPPGAFAARAAASRSRAAARARARARVGRGRRRAAGRGRRGRQPRLAARRFRRRAADRRAARLAWRRARRAPLRRRRAPAVASGSVTALGLLRERSDGGRSAGAAAAGAAAAGAAARAGAAGAGAGGRRAEGKLLARRAAPPRPVAARRRPSARARRRRRLGDRGAREHARLDALAPRARDRGDRRRDRLARAAWFARRTAGCSAPPRAAPPRARCRGDARRPRARPPRRARARQQRRARRRPRRPSPGAGTRAAAARCARMRVPSCSIARAL